MEKNGQHQRRQTDYDSDYQHGAKDCEDVRNSKPSNNYKTRQADSSDGFLITF
jgi:hypothetical protein